MDVFASHTGSLLHEDCSLNSDGSCYLQGPFIRKCSLLVECKNSNPAANLKDQREFVSKDRGDGKSILDSDIEVSLTQDLRHALEADLNIDLAEKNRYCSENQSQVLEEFSCKDEKKNKWKGPPENPKLNFAALIKGLYFKKNDFLLYITMQDTKEANRRSSSWLPPPWAIVALLVLGFNEFMTLLRNPLYIGLLFVLYLLGKALWVQLDIPGEFQHGILPGILSLSTKFLPTIMNLLKRLADEGQKFGASGAPNNTPNNPASYRNGSIKQVPLQDPSSQPSSSVDGLEYSGSLRHRQRLLFSELADTTVSASEIACHDWTIDTKYYTADVCVWVARLGDKTTNSAWTLSDHCDALVMVFDMSNSSSFEALQEWASEVDLQKFEILLCIGNKADRVPGHFAHAEYRRQLQKRGESSADPHPEFWDYGIHQDEGYGLLSEEDNPLEEMRRSCIEWCIQSNIEYIEACAINEAFDKCMSIDGDSQGVERIRSALSAHMWPGKGKKGFLMTSLIMKLNMSYYRAAPLIPGKG